MSDIRYIWPVRFSVFAGLYIFSNRLLPTTQLNINDTSLTSLLDSCLEQHLIDDYEIEGDSVHIEKHGVVRFCLSPSQARVFAKQLLRRHTSSEV